MNETVINQLVKLKVDVTELEDEPFPGLCFLGHGVTDEQVQVARKLNHVRHIGFARVSVSLRQFEALLALPGLNSFHWSNGPLSDEFVDRLGELHGLVYLSLNGPQLSAASRAKILPWIASQTDLLELHLNDCDITDEELALLAPLTKVTQLELEGNQISAKGTQQIGKLQGLRRLWLSRTKINDEALANLTGLQSLEECWLRETPITDEGLKHLAHLRSLETLLLTDCQVTAAGLTHLGTLPRLSTLSFCGAPIDDRVVALLRGTAFPQLLGFTLDENRLSKGAQKELERIREARWNRQYLKLDPKPSFWSNWESIHPMQSNWRIGDVLVDATDARELLVTQGRGALVNIRGKGSDVVSGSSNAGEWIGTLEVLVPEGSRSGIYLMGEYGIRIADSFGKAEVGDDDMGAICGVAPPRVNAAKPAGAWQQLEIHFRSPQFDWPRDKKIKPKKLENAKLIKVTLNGKVIHENVELTGPTPGGLTGQESRVGPLMLQGSLGPVAFRNFDGTFVPRPAGQWVN